MMFRTVAILLVFAAFSFGAPLTLALPDSLSKLAAAVTSQTMALQYGDALATAKKLRSVNEPAGCVIESIVRISMYDDRGDTAALMEAGKNLEKCRAQGLWDALRKFEMGYVQSEQGHSLKGALQTRSAAKMFENAKEQEARAFYAIYAYYVDKSFSWVPFKSDHREEYLAVLDSASKMSARFWPLFLTPLIWMYYDKEDFGTGLKLSERGLKKAPNHPVGSGRDIREERRGLQEAYRRIYPLLVFGAEPHPHLPRRGRQGEGGRVPQEARVPKLQGA